MKLKKQELGIDYPVEHYEKSISLLHRKFVAPSTLLSYACDIETCCMVAWSEQISSSGKISGRSYQ